MIKFLIRDISTSFLYYTSLHESFQKIIVRKELLLGHGGILHVDRFGVVAKGRCLAENDERANDRSYSEDPEEKSVENHRYETPILIFLDVQNSGNYHKLLPKLFYPLNCKKYVPR